MTSHDPRTTAFTAGSPTHRVRHRRRPGGVPNSLDIARTSFALLVTGPEPLSLDGRNFDGLPAEWLPLSLVRDQLLAASCPQATATRYGPNSSPAHGEKAAPGRWARSESRYPHSPRSPPA